MFVFLRLFFFFLPVIFWNNLGNIWSRYSLNFFPLLCHDLCTVNILQIFVCVFLMLLIVTVPFSFFFLLHSTTFLPEDLFIETKDETFQCCMLSCFTLWFCNRATLQQCWVYWCSSHLLCCLSCINLSNAKGVLSVLGDFYFVFACRKYTEFEYLFLFLLEETGRGIYRGKRRKCCWKKYLPSNK